MTTPSTSDLSALREVAEKATPGPWKHVTYMSGTQNVEYPGSKGITFGDQVIAADASDICYESDAQPLPFINISHRREDKGSEVDPQRSLNAAFIAAANPQTVLALLDHLAAEKARAHAAEAAVAEQSQREEDAVASYERQQATISTLTAERDALKRERDEAREALTRSTIERVRTLIDWLDEHEDNASLLIGSLTAQQIEAARSALSDKGE